jgi:hypothetical protein
MADYVSKILLSINGQEITDFKSVTEKEYTVRKPVNLMNKTGFLDTTPRHGCEVEYVVPEEGAEFDFDSVVGGTLVITFMNGETTTYTGVATLDVGATKYDGDNEATRTIQFGAKGRI